VAETLKAYGYSKEAQRPRIAGRRERQRSGYTSQGLNVKKTWGRSEGSGRNPAHAGAGFHSERGWLFVPSWPWRAIHVADELVEIGVLDAIEPGSKVMRIDTSVCQILQIRPA